MCLEQHEEVSRHLLVSCTDGALRRVERDTGNVASTIAVDKEMLTSGCAVPGGGSCSDYVCSAHLGQVHHAVMNDGGECSTVRSWSGHEFDAWCVASISTSDQGSGQVIFTGGDDGFLRMWDLRTPNSSPTDAAGKMRYDAGVVTIFMPGQQQQSRTSSIGSMMLVGSYDESLYLVDPRSMKRPLASVKVGGGAWRCRPLQLELGDDGSELVVCAAMQGGATVVSIQPGSMRVVGSFCNDRDDVLCYDVAVLPQPVTTASQQVTSAMVVTCSFYERQLDCWRWALPLTEE